MALKGHCQQCVENSISQLKQKDCKDIQWHQGIIYMAETFLNLENKYLNAEIVLKFNFFSWTHTHTHIHVQC